MKEKNKDQWNEYMRKYRQKNLEKIRESDRKRSRTPQRKEYERKRNRRRYQDPLFRQKALDRSRKWCANNRERVRERSRRFYERNKSQILPKERRSRLEIRLEILILLGSKCVRCGFEDVRALQIDHIKGGGRKEVRRMGSRYNPILESIQRGEQKYQLLCANCNMIKAIENKEQKSLLGALLCIRS